MGMSVERCNDCNLCFADPMPSSKTLQNYNSEYFFLAHGTKSRERIDNPLFKALARIRFNYILEFLEAHDIKIQRVLEIGPGYGEMASLWVESTPKIEYFAIESDKSCHAYLKEIGVKVGARFSEIGHIDADLVIMSHVLEHVTDPKDFLKTASQCLRVGGVLFIEVPCQDYKYKTMVEPHLLFFDLESLGKLIANQGYRNLKINYWGNSQSCHQDNYYLIKYIQMVQMVIKLRLSAFVKLLLGNVNGLEFSKEVVATLPFKPNIQSEKPAWWIRAMAIRSESV